MKHFYIYSYKTKGKKNKNIIRLVIFCPYRFVGKYITNFKQQLRNYLLENVPPDEIFIIGGDYHRNELIDAFEKNSSSNFDIIPHFNNSLFKDSIYIFTFEQSGKFINVNANSSKKHHFEIKEVINRGMVNIFKRRGGLIIAHEAHHFVFPSGKHCDRFLRTGNVLIHGPEIYFLASQVLRYFAGRNYETIYSDTSSINSLVLATNDLIKRFDNTHITPHLESFGSYEKFEKEKFSDGSKSFFLISSSTSGSIIKRMLKHAKDTIELDQIAVMFGLNVITQFKKQVICDLTFDPITNPEGIAKFNTANSERGESCKLCEEGSAKVKVQGDVFLLEKPVVNEVLVLEADQPLFLKKFINEFKTVERKEPSAIRCHYKECNSDKNYEVFIDMEHILDSWNSGDTSRYSTFYNKFQQYVQKYIPASVKYLVHLPDESSRKMTKLMNGFLAQTNNAVAEDNILTMDEIDKIPLDIHGTIVIISSCIVTGKNLLYLSRALRKTEDTMSRIFFTGIKRTSDEEHKKFLKSNLGFGEYGGGTHQVINVEEIYCDALSKDTPWHIELEFSKKMQEFLEELNPEKYETIIQYFHQRQIEIGNSGAKKGLSDNLFFQHPYSNSALVIRKGFVFADNQQFQENASQSDVYFIISSILNGLRNSNDKTKALKQSEHVRNLIAPENFSRFNDGIIQASFLRAARREELSYNLSDKHSSSMQLILGDMIRNLKDDHAEALTEFFYAIAIKKLKLTHQVTRDCIDLFNEEIKLKNISVPILESIILYIEHNVCPTLSIHDRFNTIVN